MLFYFKSIVIWEGLGNPAHSYQPPALLRRLCLPPEADEVLYSVGAQTRASADQMEMKAVLSNLPSAHTAQNVLQPRSHRPPPLRTQRLWEPRTDRALALLAFMLFPFQVQEDTRNVNKTLVQEWPVTLSLFCFQGNTEEKNFQCFVTISDILDNYHKSSQQNRRESFHLIWYIHLQWEGSRA